MWDVRGLLLQCNLNMNTSWKAILVPPTTRDSLQAKIGPELDKRMAGLLSNLPGPAPKSVPGFAVALQQVVQDWFTGRLPSLVPNQLNTGAAGVPQPNVTANPQSTRSAQGLSVMVGTLDANGSNTATGDDTNDPLRTMAGLCVLMRQTSTIPWRCLNAGIPVASVNPLPADPAMRMPAVEDPAQIPANPLALAKPIVIPMPLHNQDGLRRATLTYNNQPLMCSSPAHGFSNGLASAPVGSRSRNFDRLISFQHLSVTQDLTTAPNNQWKIPGLAFKRSYDFLLGSVSNSGALPAAFADPVAGPGVFSFAAVNGAKGADGNPLPPTIPAVPYLRTVPASDLLFASYIPPDPTSSRPSEPVSSGPTSFDKLRLPPIPADVQPRANEVNLYTSALASAPTAVGTTPAKPSMPLVLLSPYPGQIAEFDLWVRKPTTDFLTWDRTQAALADPAVHTQRQQAWELFNTNARNEKSQFDLSLADPAIDSLTIAVFDENKKNVICNGSNPLSWSASRIQDPKTATALQTKTPPIVIKITTSVTAATHLQGTSAASPTDPPTFTLTLPPGFLCQIQLTANPKPGVTGQFAPNISTAPETYSIMVETASAAFPQPVDIQNALSIQPPLAAADPVTFALMAPTSPVVLAAWKQISRVDLQTQIWRWDGRPSSGFPFSEVVGIHYGNPIPPATLKQPPPVPPPQPATLPLLQWELENFATRTAADVTTRPMSRNGTSFIADDDRGTELGATYYRAGVTAYNRYGSLVPDTLPGAADGTPTQVRSSSSMNQFASIPGAEGAWVRRFVPGRYTADGLVPTSYKPPKPAIKYMVPLTGGPDASQASASSVLVVVQGPWFAIAGLAEDISVRIVTSDPQDHPNTLPEAGPDPIYYQSSQTLPSLFDPYPSPFPPPSDKTPKLLFHGPVGHTFDSSDTNPLWVTSSFVLDPPTEHFPLPKPADDWHCPGRYFRLCAVRTSHSL